MANCQTVTIPAPTPSFTTPTIDDVSTDVGEATVSYSLSNEGGGRGTERVEITADVSVGGEVDATKTKQHTVDPGESASGSVTFSFPDLIIDTEVKFCVQFG